MAKSAKRTEIVILTIDPLSPNGTIISYSASFDEPDFTPIGYEGAGVLAALYKGDFFIEEVEAGPEWVQYTFLHTNYKSRYKRRLTNAFRDLPFEPVT